MAAEGGFSLREAELREVVEEATSRGFGGHRFDCFVETGTFLGHTVIALAHCFREVHTIEIRWPCFLAARLASWRAKRPITFHWGESLDVLPELLPLLAHAAVFFLDAHFSGGPTGGQRTAVPLLRELQTIDALFRHAAIIIIDDMDMFGKEHTFDSCDDNWKFTGFCKTDWRGTDCEAILACLQPSRAACAFAIGAQNRFVVGLRALDAHPAQRMGRSADWVFGHTHWRSRPGKALDEAALRELREHGRGWSDVAAMIEGAFYSGRGASGKKPEQRRGAKMELTRAQMTKEQCEDMHDAFIAAYAKEEFQAKLREAWAEAQGDKLKQLAAKQDICFPIQMDIISKYNFERSKKGMLLSWLVEPGFQDQDRAFGRERLSRWHRR